jgi:AGCS family alanine or glycine:cation symporter
MKYLFGIKVTYPYRVIFVGLIFTGSVISIKLAFYVGDIANALMAFPNLIALAMMSGTIGMATRQFFKKYPKISDFDG